MIVNMLCLIGGAKQNHIKCMVFGLFILWMICEGGFGSSPVLILDFTVQSKTRQLRIKKLPIVCILRIRNQFYQHDTIKKSIPIVVEMGCRDLECSTRSKTRTIEDHISGYKK